MTKKRARSDADILADARKRLEEMVPKALEALEKLSKQTKNKTVAAKAKRLLDKYKGRK